MRNPIQFICVMFFDQTNEQKYYKYVGETYSGDVVVGNIVYDGGTSTYSPRYYIYASANYRVFSGGEVDDHGMCRVEVRPDSIRPYTQVERIKEQLRMGNRVKLIRNRSKDSFNEPISIITNEKEIPYSLWFKNDKK